MVNALFNDLGLSLEQYDQAKDRKQCAIRDNTQTKDGAEHKGAEHAVLITANVHVPLLAV